MDKSADLRVPLSSLSGRPRRSTSVSNNATTSSAATYPRRFSMQVQEEEGESQSQVNDYPHLAGSPNCLCTICHLRDVVFPRRQDGRIVLPAPWHLPSLSEQRNFGVQGRPRGLTTGHFHVPGGEGSQGQRRNSVALIAGSSQRHGSPRESEETNTDRGGGTSQSGARLSGPGIAGTHTPLSSPVQTTEGRLPRAVSDRSKSSRRSKPYGRIGKVDLRPQTEQQEASSISGHDTSVFLYPPRSQATTQVAGTPGDSPSTPWEGQRPQNFRHPGLPSTNLPVPSTSTSAPSIRGAGPSFSEVTVEDHMSGHSHLSLSFWNPAPPSQSSSWNERPPTSRSISTPPVPLPSSQDQLKFIHSKPQGSQSRRVAAPSSIRVIPQPSTSKPSQNYFAWRSREEEPEPEPPVRFQEPVVSDMSRTGSPTQRGGLPIKWDSERKRRQGYEEGSEKSNFRHYSSSKIFE